MGANTKIEWADHTFNPWEGCQKVGPGCDNCYAEARNARFAGGVAINWGPGAPRRRTSPANWAMPRRWDAEAKMLGRRFRVFCASLADVFDNEGPLRWRQDLMTLVVDTPNLDWLFLTKRIGNAARQLRSASDHDGRLLTVNDQYAPPPNLWIGATICNQEEADRDIPKLLQVPAAKRFLSMEPLLGPVDLPGLVYYGTQSSGGVVPLRDKGYPQIDWVIVGGESGPNARTMHPAWVRSLRDQCTAARVPFLFKQWGEHTYTDAPDAKWEDGTPVPAQLHPVTVSRVGKKAAGRLLDGRAWDEVPA